MSDIEPLLELMARLRDPQGGCPWDQQQDFESIVPYTLEEAYEVADAVQRRDYPHLKDELGDLLFQVVFLSQLARESGYFDFHEVVRSIVDKMTRRHPHVFGDAVVEDAEQQSLAWEALKADERQAGESSPGSALDGVALSLPALSRAAKLQKRAARHGFDWPGVEPVMDKVHEELDELRQVLRSGDRDRQEEELGDLLFSCVNLARHLKLDPEHCLRQANTKFSRRFTEMERRLQQQGETLEGTEAARLEALWSQVKLSEQTDKNR